MDQEREFAGNVGGKPDQQRREFLGQALGGVGALATVGALTEVLLAGPSGAQRDVRRGRDQPAHLPREVLGRLEQSRDMLRDAVADAWGLDRLQHLDRVVPLLRQGNEAAARDEWRQSIDPGLRSGQQAADYVILMAMQIHRVEAARDVDAMAAILAMLDEFEHKLQMLKGRKIDDLLNARIKADAASDLSWLRVVIAVMLLMLTLLLWLLADDRD